MKTEIDIKKLVLKLSEAIIKVLMEELKEKADPRKKVEKKIK